VGETIKAARTALDVLTSAGVILPPSLPVVRRLSTVPGRQGLIDFEESMIIWEVREVECSDRSAAWFRFDPLLCSQRAKGAAPASVAGGWFKGRAIVLGASRHGRKMRARAKIEARGNQRGRLKDC